MNWHAIESNAWFTAIEHGEHVICAGVRPCIARQYWARVWVGDSYSVWEGAPTPDEAKARCERMVGEVIARLDARDTGTA